MYILRHRETGKYLTGRGWRASLVDDIRLARHYNRACDASSSAAQTGFFFLPEDRRNWSYKRTQDAKKLFDRVQIDMIVPGEVHSY